MKDKIESDLTFERKFSIPMIYVCAAMLHGNYKCNGSIIQINISDKNGNYLPNHYVKQLISPVNIAGQLDCDVDFKLEAVLLLVDRMRKNRKILAVCGQIHPTSDESTVCSIVCCLRCFLLSRASSLMDDNVMRRYANKSTETAHYDQGENLWLKTLLIEQVYRVEYCDASDAYTHAQETFKEFFNQHRHWMSSTIVNIMDLLKDTKHTKDMLMKLFQNYVLSSCFFISTMLR
ncbi:unnamed protein product [Rotaria socialis]